MNKYVIDASSLINAKEIYPPINFKSFWDLLHDLNLQDRLIILKKVKKELMRGYDYVSEDFLLDKKITDDEDKETIHCLDTIMKKIPSSYKEGFGEWLKSPDPYIIAYTLKISKITDERVILIHDEVERGNRIKIPHICRLMGIENGKMNKIITEEQIQFTIIHSD